MSTKMRAEENGFKYFQYCRELGHSVYLRYSEQIFSPKLANFLEDMGFDPLEEREVIELMAKKPRENNKFRILTLVEASLRVSAQIQRTLESDRFGQESVVPREGYKVYRFKNTALMVYSERTNFWEMGCFSDFGSGKDLFAYRSVINRYLTWALVPHGVLGFWGVPIEEGVALLRPGEGEANAVFFDIFNRKMIFGREVRSFPQPLKILELDKNLEQQNRSMRQEELLGLLSRRNTYLSISRHPVPVRQILQKLSSLGQGYVHGREFFRTKTDLAL